jgi:hypothetical protein
MYSSPYALSVNCATSRRPVSYSVSVFLRLHEALRVSVWLNELEFRKTIRKRK